MTVVLNNNNEPVAWGEKLADGRDIPNPPSEILNAPDEIPVWDGEAGSWVSVPDKTRRKEFVDRSKISEDTKQKIIDARDEGDYETALNHVLDVLDVIDLTSVDE